MSMEKGTRTRLTTLLILLLVLTTGATLGIAGDRLLSAPDPEESEASSGRDEARSGEENQEGGEERGENRRRRSHLVEQVGLSFDQKTQVDTIVAQFRRRIGDLRERRDELHAEMDSTFSIQYGTLLGETREEIKALLTSEQRMEYDSILVDYDRRRDERRARDTISDSRG